VDVPISVFVSEQGVLPISIGLSKIDPSYIAEISEEEDVDRPSARLSIISWLERNYDVDVDFKRISKIGDLDQVEMLAWYKLSLKKKESFEEEDSYLIIDYPKSKIKFKKDYDEDDIGDDKGTYVYVDEEGKPSSVEFLIVEALGAPGVEDLGVYISPKLSRLDVDSGLPLNLNFVSEEGVFLWGKFLIAMAILFAVALFVYVMLYSWYKRYYEKHLFKNPNALYNLINFIYNSRRAGLKGGDIRSKLKEKSWNGEQINYAIRKLDGKRTGMLEIPIFKFVENREVKKQIEKRQGRPVDTRFIKQPRF